MADGEWQVATCARRKRRAASTKHNSAPPTEAQVQRCCAAVDAAAGELARAPFWQHLLSQLQQLPPHCALASLQHLVLFGLGSLQQPGALHIRYQLAAARLLAALLPPGSRAEAFDPVFTPLDRAVLAHCGIQVAQRDEGGRRVAGSPTLFFMPHCEAALTDALLEANAAAGTLHNVLLLGNRFSGYRDSWALASGGVQPGIKAAERGGTPPTAAAAAAAGEAVEQRCAEFGSGSGQGQPWFMLRLCQRGAVRELSVGECGFPVASAFNDLGLHWFPPDWRDRLAGGACHASPSYRRSGHSGMLR